MFLPISTWRSWPLGRNQSCQPVKEMLPLFLGLRLSFRVEAPEVVTSCFNGDWWQVMAILLTNVGYFLLRDLTRTQDRFFNNTWTWMVGCFLHLHAESFIYVYIYIFIFQLRVLFDIVMYTCILFIWQETKLETQKSNTLKSAFPINSDGSWSDLTNCSSNMGSKASSCCVVFFFGGGGVEKFLDLKLAETFLGVSCFYFWCSFMSLLLRFLQSAFSIPIKLEGCHKKYKHSQKEHS